MTLVAEDVQQRTLLPGYRLERLTAHGDMALFRAVADEGVLASLLVAAPVGPMPKAESLARLSEILALREDLDSSWATTPREVVEHDGRPVLLLEDPRSQDSDATLLSQTVGASWELHALLCVARGIASALAKLHARGLIHQDIRPSSVFVSVADGSAWLTSFGIASRLPRERQAPAPPQVIDAALAYMSPEQTGRMNRSIDSRSDLYSLGVTLYELATGVLPFSAVTPLEWTHCHIAREPASAGGAVPVQVQAIIRKLLAKNAEDRYQTAAGLASDLQRCLAELELGGHIDAFPLGENDAPDHLMVPEKLYGRDDDVAVIGGALERVLRAGTPELVLVSGYSGIGKSSVVNELHKRLVSAQGLFAAGKFDQHRRDVPYATIAQALQGILHEILGKSDAELADWRVHLLQALGPSGQLLSSLLPELALVIGAQPAVPDLPPQEAKARYQKVLRDLLGAFASRHGAFALFLDDLQWVDSATIELLEALFSGAPVQKLLLIGAYRDNEVGPDHVLTSAIARVREGGAAVSELVLGPLSASDVERLIADALRVGRERVAPLSRLIHDKTGGNPFFAIQFLTGLVDEGLVAHDAERRHWSWDAERILAKTFTDNIVPFMVAKLERLPATTQAALRDLACLGSVSPPGTLALVYGEGLDAAMWAAIRAGLVFRAGSSYGFLHDRVQEAAYQLLPEEARPAGHLRLARLLAERLAATELDGAIFDVVNQFNRAIPLLASRDEQRKVAQLNLAAGRRARAASAHASAQTYFTAGRSALGEDAWQTDRALIFELELRSAECELLVGEQTRAEERLTLLWQRSRDTVERASVTCLRILLHGRVHRLDRCIEVGLEYLGKLGITWAPKPSQEDVARELASLWQHVGERSIEELLELPLMTDAASRSTMDVLAGLLGPAYAYSPSLLVLCVVHMTRLSIDQGNSDATVLAYGFLAVIIIGPRGARYRDGYRFGRLAVDLVERRGLDRFKGRVGVVFAASVLPWTQHIGESRGLLRRAAEACMETADTGYAAYGGYLRVAARLSCGDPLDDVQREAEEVLSFSRETGYSVGVEFVTVQLAVIRPLRDLSLRIGCLENEAELERRYEQTPDGGGAKSAQNAIWLHLGKLQSCVFAGEQAEARLAAAKARGFLGRIMERFELAEYHFYSALAHADPASADVVREHHEKLAGWAADCPENFGCREAAVAAELARIEGRELEAERLYDSALRLARQHGFVQIEALANELASRFHLARGFDTIGDAYLAAARDAYLRWGAHAKVRQVDERFPQLAAGRGPSSARSAPLSTGDLDLATVVKVSQAVSAEIVLDTLVERIMTIAIENAGAERGLLLVPSEAGLRIEAQAVAAPSGVTVEMSAAEVSGFDAPESILRYVARTRESVILDDASVGPGPFVDDPYVQASRLRSVLCVPLVKQARLIGVLYLENNLLSQVFNPRRIALLELLASQAAISLENARLHRELQNAQSGLRDALLENRLMNDAIPALSWCSTPDGSAELFNQPWRDYTGLSREQSIGWGWTVVLHPDDQKDVQRRWESIRAAGAPGELELRIRRHDGVYRWFLVHVRPLLDEHGRVIRWYGTNLDIEDLRRAQDEIRRNEGFLANGQRLSATGSFLWRPGSQELTFSDELRRIFDISRDAQLTIETIVQRVHPEDRPLATENMALSESGMPHEAYELRLLLPDGTVKSLQTSVHVTRDREGRLEVMGVMQDISERRLAEQAVSSVRSELASMTRVASLGTLTAAIAHEINQPLAGIIVNASTGLRMLNATSPDVARVRDTVQRTLRDGKRASDVIERIRALFTNKSTSSEAMDLNEAAREVIALCLSELRRNRVAVRSELADGLPPLVADRIQLQQVIQNLLLNASQAMGGVDDRPRHVVVRTEHDRADRVCLSVKDAGVGLLAHEVEKLFQPFHTTKKTGMGIGLTISRTIVENHGGRLWATPNRNEPGATFSFSIPRR